MILRFVAAAVGLAVLAATAHVTITSSGGYKSPHAVLTIAIAAGVGIGALAIGACWTDRRHGLAVAIALALLSGELFGLAMTAERLIAQRELAQEPARKNAADRLALAADIHRLETELATLATSPRLTTALAVQARVSATIAEKAAEKTCAANCRSLLEEQVRAATTEVEQARTALAGERTRLISTLADQRNALGRINTHVSGSPLADRLGLPAWSLDLIIAALGAIGANGLAATLLAFGAHAAHRPPPHRFTLIDAVPVTVSTVSATAVLAKAPVVVAPVVAPTVPAPVVTEVAQVVVVPEVVSEVAPEVREVAPVAPDVVATPTVSQPVAQPAPQPVAQPEPVVVDLAPAARRPVTDAKQHAARFGIERLVPSANGRTSLQALHAEYRVWCADIGSEELPPAHIAEVLAQLFAGVGITMDKGQAGQLFAVGIRIKGRRALAQSAA